MATSNITLYTNVSPNGFKVSILLEELGLPYKLHVVNMQNHEQRSPEYLEINPCGRIPALTDTLRGEKIRLFESGSIMQYLIAEYDPDHKLSYPPGTPGFYEVNNWLFFQNSTLGPIQGESSFFTRYVEEKIEVAINRYLNHTKRLYGVLEKHLQDSNREWLVGDKCTIADVAHWSYIAAAGWAGVNIDEYPALHAWEDRMYARPGVKKGADVPTPFMFKKIMADEKLAKEAAETARRLKMQGMQKDAEDATL